MLIPRIDEAGERRRARKRLRAENPGLYGTDPGRERRAEQRARQLLESCVDEEEAAMYRDLGFLRIWGRQAGDIDPNRPPGAPYAYLIYPHKPIVAFVPQTRPAERILCVSFPDETRPYGSARLPDSTTSWPSGWR